MKEWFEKLTKDLKGTVGYISLCIILILITASVTGTAATASFNKTINLRIDQRIDARLNESALPMLREIKQSVDFLVASSYSDYIVKLNKQLEKIKDDPVDIKMIDMEDVLQKWKTFPEDRKTDDLIAKYTIIRNWYSKHQ
jgi:hypothetical protein